MTAVKKSRCRALPRVPSSRVLRRVRNSGVLAAKAIAPLKVGRRAALGAVQEAARGRGSRQMAVPRAVAPQALPGARQAVLKALALTAVQVRLQAARASAIASALRLPLRFSVANRLHRL